VRICRYLTISLKDRNESSDPAKLLTHHSWQGALRDNDVTIYGGERAAHALGLPPAPEVKFEYGSKALTLELVASLEEAVNHIHRYGSSHTETIVTG
jgi:gamma-glutamyl phosphate reductase